MPIWCRFTTCIVLLACAGPKSAHSQQGAPDLSQINTSELNGQARSLTFQRRYDEAVPLLEELISRLEETVSPEIENDLKSAYLFLGVGRMIQNELAKAIGAFEAMEKRFPKDVRTRLAIDFRGDCLFNLGEYDLAAQAWKFLLENFTLEPDFYRDTVGKLGDAYLASQKWKEALEVLRPLFVRMPPGLGKARLAGDLIRCHVELGEIEMLVALMPFVDDHGAQVRTDLNFNLTLIRGGDRMFAEGKHLEALLCYQLVYPLEKIKTVLAERLEMQKKRRVAVLKAGGTDLRSFVAAGTQIAKTQAEIEEISEVEPYTPELNFRLAQLYYAMGRPFEAIWAFSETWHKYPEHPSAERGLYAAAALAAEVGLDEKALRYAGDYVGAYPNGEFYEETAKLGAQIYSRRKRWEECEAWCTDRMEARPDAPVNGDLLFFRGYSRFQQERHPDAIADYSVSLEKYPAAETREQAMYWLPMALLFHGELAECRLKFEEYLARYPSGSYEEDSRFRVGAASYGLGEFDRARPELERFISDYPSAVNRAEAHNILGDIAGAEGRLEDAAKEYSEAPRHTDAIAQIDYATFKLGEVFELLERWEDMEKTFSEYLDKYGLAGRYTEAIWRIGFAQAQRGDHEKMLATYADAIARFVDDRKAVGVDLILDDWVRESRRIRGVSLAKELQARAREKVSRRTAHLRYLRALHAAGENGLPEGGFQEKDVSVASPAVLLWMAEICRKTHEAVAVAALETLCAEFGETEWVEPALLELGKIRDARGDREGALKMYDEIFRRFPTSERAGEALARKAEILAASGKPAEAVETLEMVLAAKEYKGPLWPAALYRIGELLEAQGKTREAFAYYQRVTILYQHYADWTAKAYLRSGEVLEKLGIREDAARTYEEMLGHEFLSGFNEYAEAQQRLAKLR